MTEQPTAERIDATDDEPLPNGGAYAICYFRDADGTPTTREEAMKIEAVEFNEAGKPIAMTFIDLTLEDVEEAE
ncbi:MAG TPA: hypothetical protein V6D10_07110 [Trichocoleus sp.]|jgi:hypothetical protein